MQVIQQLQWNKKVEKAAPVQMGMLWQEMQTLPQRNLEAAAVQAPTDAPQTAAQTSGHSLYTLAVREGEQLILTAVHTDPFTAAVRQVARRNTHLMSTQKP